MEVYKNCVIGKINQSKKDGRLRLTITFPCGKRVWKSYPNYLMELKLNRYLLPDETVDHIDNDFLNNDYNNLRVINRVEHCIDDAIRNQDVEVECSYCNKKFTIKGSTLHSRNRKDRKNSGYFCSRSCSGKYGKEIQMGLRNVVYVDKIKAIKYKQKTLEE